MADLWPDNEPIDRLIERVRTRQGKSQYSLADDLAEASGNPSITREYVYRWETRRRIPTPYWRRHLHTTLGIPVAVLDKAALVAKCRRSAEPARYRQQILNAVPIRHACDEQFVDTLVGNWPGVRLSRPVPDYGIDWHLELPDGRFVEGGGRAAVQVHSVTSLDEPRTAWAFADRLPRLDQFPSSQRGMVIGIDERAGTTRLLALDAREARRQLARPPSAQSAPVIPQAYELDDITYGIIWALTNLDDALLDADHALAERRQELIAYENLPSSAVSHRVAADLTSTAQMWLGSDFCARHILRHLAAPGRPPVFWTREQTGEEACAWLLFRHKYNYLKRTAPSGSSHEPMVRGFCIPETAIAESPRWERVLLFLSVALMEAMGIRPEICIEREYSEVDGFVLLPGERAIIATWIRADGVWHVDATSRNSIMGDFAEVVGHVGAHSAIAAPSPAGRLRALADYLGLDWAWLQRRCAELGASGCAGLVSPRSRLIAVEGLDAALAYVGAIGRHE